MAIARSDVASAVGCVKRTGSDGFPSTIAAHQRISSLTVRFTHPTRMAHLFQVGAGSGGMTVIDIVCRDPRITAVTLIEPDVYKPHNVERHLFPPAAVGRLKAEVAAEWLAERRPDL